MYFASTSLSKPRVAPCVVTNQLKMLIDYRVNSAFSLICALPGIHRSLAQRTARFVLIAILLNLAACGGGVGDDLFPSGEDKRPGVEAGSIGTQVGQLSPDFTLADTLGSTHSLTSELVTADAVVMYFTMWCPICDSHSSHLRTMIMPDFPNVRFFLVDYVSGSIDAARAAQVANGYASLTVLVDTVQDVFNLYHASMGTTVVIDSTGIVKMNEDYKDGVKLRQILETLP